VFDSYICGGNINYMLIYDIYDYVLINYNCISYIDNSVTEYLKYKITYYH